MPIRKTSGTVNTTGSAGSASGSAILSTGLGELVAVHLDYHASAPATSDVVITSEGVPADVTLLTRSNSATDAWLYPTVNVHDNAGAAVAGAQAAPVVHNGALSVSVAQCDALTSAVTVTAYVRV